MNKEFKAMELCFQRKQLGEDAWMRVISEAVLSESYLVRYSAAVAIGKYGNKEHIGLLADLAKREEKDPLYTQPDGLKNTDADAGDNRVGDVEFPDGTSEYEKQAWQRRGKIKQAVCLSVGEIYQREKDTDKWCGICDILHKYAVDQSEDYCVRAAAARALRFVGANVALEVLETAADDPEWCTKTEAQKSIKAIKEKLTELPYPVNDFAYNEDVNKTPFYIDNAKQLRAKVLNTNNEFINRLWTGIKNRARKTDGKYPWFEPFTALITEEKTDCKRSRDGIRSYVNSLEKLRYNPGVHFHSWCFALPHARWTLYLQWMYTMGEFSKDEAEELMQKLTAHQFMYYYSCYRVKPCPETVDNQTLALAISNALVGYIFGNPPFNSHIARLMFCESIGRVEFVLEKMGEEKYSGEGSTYMNHVIASCIPLGTELIERIYGRNCFGKCRSTAEMMAYEVMPDGLALPWDHYGYILPTLQCLSYNSRRIDSEKYTKMLDEYGDYAFSIVNGWGFDDLVWTIIWYEESDVDTNKKIFESWYMKDIAACIVSKDMSLCAVQMFDMGKSEHIARFHCNPNALVLSAYGSPLLTEGVPTKDCDRFKYKETEKCFGFMSLAPITVNDGYGCAGAHSVILVDGYEAMRPTDSSKQTGEVIFDKENNSVYADVTPIYRQNFPDAQLVARKSTLMFNRFWLIEDTLDFEKEHKFTMRLIARSKAQKRGDWICTLTPEGVGMYIREISGKNEIKIEELPGYPNTLDKKSVIIDSIKYGKSITMRHIIVPYECKSECEDITDNWLCAADDEGYSYDEALKKIADEGINVSVNAPCHFFRDTEYCDKWWYRKKIKAPADEFLLRLPRNLHEAEIWINGKKYDAEETGLMPAYITVKDCGEWIDIVFSVHIGKAQYKDKYNGGGFFGKAAVYTLNEAVCPCIEKTDGEIVLKYKNDTYAIKTD